MSDQPFDQFLVSPEFFADPFPTFAQLRQCDPVYWSQSWNSWLITRYADVVAMLRAPSLFSNVGRQTALLDQLPESARENFQPLRRIFASGGLLNSDPPDHTRLRKLVNQAFTPGIVAELEPRVEQIVDELLDTAAVNVRMDVVGDFAYPLPTTVIAELLGVPRTESARFNAVSLALRSYFGGTGYKRLENAKRVQASLLDAYDYFRGVLAERRKSPRRDLLTALVEAEEDGSILSEDELLATCTILIQAGHETTANLIANGLLTLLNHPDQFEQLRQNPSLMPRALEEILRYKGSVADLKRVVARDTEFGGKTMKEGQMVYLLLASANHDPEVFTDPERFDITRPEAENRHIAFGHSIHFCIGAPLARLETTIALRALLDRFSRLRLVEQPEYTPGMLRPVLKWLWVELG